MKRFGFLFFCTILALFLCTQAQSQTPVMGWSSWNTYHLHISDSLILRQGRLLVSLGLKDAGYDHVNIDDGFFGYRDSTGEMHEDRSKFPSGMATVASGLHSLGLKVGIYSDAGSCTCGSLWNQDHRGLGAGLYGHEHQDADLYFNRWGFDYIKIDCCGAGQELDLDEETRYGEICRVIDSVSCRPVEINICRWAFPGIWASRMAGSWRVSEDINPSWKSIRSIIGKNLYLSAFAGRGHYNDMDMLVVGMGLPWNEEEVHFGMWCLMSSPLVIGCDLGNIPDSSLELLKNRELLALDRDSLGEQAYVVQHVGEGYVLVKDLLQRRGLTRAVALYNPSDRPLRFFVPLSALEFQGKTRFRDLIRHRDLKTVKDSLTCTVEAHGVLMLKAWGRQRIEPSSYEAEWAFLPAYDNLGRHRKAVDVVSREGASGGVVVTHLGGDARNVACWEVYSERGGSYEMSVRYLPARNRRLEVKVDGHSYRVGALAETGGFSTLTLRVNLHPGFNQVELGSRYFWAPDIDRLDIKRLM